MFISVRDRPFYQCGNRPFYQCVRWVWKPSVFISVRESFYQCEISLFISLKAELVYGSESQVFSWVWESSHFYRSERWVLLPVWKSSLYQCESQVFFINLKVVLPSVWEMGLFISLKNKSFFHSERWVWKPSAFINVREKSFYQFEG